MLTGFPNGLGSLPVLPDVQSDSASHIPAHDLHARNSGRKGVWAVSSAVAGSDFHGTVGSHRSSVSS